MKDPRIKETRNPKPMKLYTLHIWDKSTKSDGLKWLLFSPYQIKVISDKIPDRNKQLNSSPSSLPDNPPFGLKINIRPESALI